VNDILCEENEIKMFVTVWLGILDLKTGLMRCCNAGHEYPALMRAGGDFELLKDKHGLFLGARPGIPRCEYEIQLESGDRLFVYTDGVPEALNENAEQYGTARMIDHLNTLKDQPQDRLLSGMLENVRRFAGEAEQFDDITMLGITWTRPD
jgi:serine phosphatase RsbU (regulator of sigma subunit)